MTRSSTAVASGPGSGFAAEGPGAGCAVSTGDTAGVMDTALAEVVAAFGVAFATGIAADFAAGFVVVVVAAGLTETTLLDTEVAGFTAAARTGVAVEGFCTGVTCVAVVAPFEVGVE